MNSKKNIRSRSRLSILLWLVLFVFCILFISILVAGVIWHIMMAIDILPGFGAGRAIHWFLFLLLVSLLIGTTLTAIVGEQLLRPLHRLIDATKEIASGNFDVHVKVEGPRELERLAVSFNEMTKELANIEALRMDFTSNISHEFKTPLASVKGYAKRLTKSNLPEEQRQEYANIILTESERLSRLSSNILLLSKLETTEKNERCCYSLDEQLRQIILLLEPQLQKKQLMISVDLEKININSNEEMLHHVWINLLENAIKFSRMGEIIKIHLNLQNGNACVIICDSGIGMDESVKKRIFEKFYQGDESRTTTGNGLGLSLVKRILELEGGSIKVESELDRGTCFFVDIPV